MSAPRLHRVLARVLALGLAAAWGVAVAQFESDESVEVSGVVSIEAKSNTFKACGYNNDPVALWPPNAAAELIERAKREGKYNWAASQHFVYAKVQLTYVRDARQKQACIGELRGVSKCATLGPTFTLYRGGTPGSCRFW